MEAGYFVYPVLFIAYLLISAVVVALLSRTIGRDDPDE